MFPIFLFSLLKSKEDVNEKEEEKRRDEISKHHMFASIWYDLLIIIYKMFYSRK